MSAENPTPTRDSKVTLREITEDTVDSICKLRVHDDQKGFLADNATSIAEAHFSPHAWFRAIYADETPVGFVMVEDKPDVPQYFLERFMIDIRYQRLKLGRQAMEQVIEHIKTRPNATHLLTSVHQGPGGPQPFYEGLGFKLTGDMEHARAAIMRLEFPSK